MTSLDMDRLTILYRCFEWAVKGLDVGDNDTCENMEELHSISFQYLQSLNPDIDADCSNLEDGNAYCSKHLPF